jgi:hypothetical protein
MLLCRSNLPAQFIAEQAAGADKAEFKNVIISSGF